MHCGFRWNSARKPCKDSDKGLVLLARIRQRVLHPLQSSAWKLQEPEHMAQHMCLHVQRKTRLFKTQAQRCQMLESSQMQQPVARYLRSLTGIQPSAATIKHAEGSIHMSPQQDQDEKRHAVGISNTKPVCTSSCTATAMNGTRPSRSAASVTKSSVNIVSSHS